MNRKLRFVLTAMFVVVLMAIYVVGIFLLWDIFDVNTQLDTLFETDIYGTEYKPVSETAVDISFDGKDITEAEEQLFREYFTYFFAGLGAMRTENMVRFYTQQCNDELFDGLAMDYETYLLRNCPLDLSFGSCRVTAYIRRRHSVPKSEKFEIDVEITAELNYANVGKKGIIRGEKHNFVLDESGKTPLVLNHSTTRPAYTAASKGLDTVLTANGLKRSDLSYTYFPKYTNAALDMLIEAANDYKFYTSTSAAYPKTEFDYDRDTASNAAEKGFSGDGAFTHYEENDANYISRCIFEGGIPMDSQGGKYDQWKWYDEEVNTERKKTGCSQSWFDREAFYKYVTVNEGFGLAGCEVSNGDGQLGDVVQLVSGGKAVAEFMITGIMTASDGSVMDYLLSNDVYSSVSMMTFGFTDIRVLHIVGYNTANI